MNSAILMNFILFSFFLLLQFAYGILDSTKRNQKGAIMQGVEVYRWAVETPEHPTTKQTITVV